MPVEYFISSLVIAAVIGATTCYIAYQQYTQNKIQTNIQSYDRRLIIYKAVKGFVREILVSGSTNYESTRAFYLETAEADFIIHESIRGYIDLLYSKGSQLAALDKKMYSEHGNKPRNWR